MELLSNCCGARVGGLNADNIGICSECKEGCGVEEVGIEKLKIPKTKCVIGLRDAEGKDFLELKMMGEKVNEIIDKLSEQKQ